jgi:ABC-type phosphate transport system ATPase subunit
VTLADLRSVECSSKGSPNVFARALRSRVLEQILRRPVLDEVAEVHERDLVEYGTVTDVFEDPRAERTREYVRGAFG